MAEVVGFQSFHSLRFPSSSSSLLVNSFASNLKNSVPLSRNCLYERIYPVVYSTARVVSWLPFDPRKQSLSFKVPTFFLFASLLIV
uniref:Uncharacterized protein n=1 Tax=Rhizophora mucronata TaxID=61149 RepID=A0A2P2IMN9_RHIMU